MPSPAATDPRAQARPAAETRPLVWDLPVRVFHALAATSFIGAYLTAEQDDWHGLHVMLGSTFAGLILFRLVWGLVGTRHARFGAFVRGPAAAGRYLRRLLGGHPDHHAGHNPAGALAIVALLALGLWQGVSGWLIEQDLAGHLLEDLHEFSGNLLLALVGLHLVGVVVGSWAHRENLARAMVTGRKRAAPSEGIRRARGGVALALALAVFGFWAWQLPQALAPQARHAAQPHGAEAGDHGHTGDGTRPGRPDDDD